MKIVRYLYRTRQFFAALFAKPDDREWETARKVLTPAQMEIFARMQANEQKHSLMVLKRLQSIDEQWEGPGREDLMVAALLHDVGKSCYPLRLWERVMVVLAKSLFPRGVKRWGTGKPYGWRRAFVVSEQHPQWGAEMIAEAGASPLTVELIRAHQNFLPPETVTLEARLLKKLQIADNRS
jgi:putative nucleotidyltransferase with HDIG domain